MVLERSAITWSAAWLSPRSCFQSRALLFSLSRGFRIHEVSRPHHDPPRRRVMTLTPRIVSEKCGGASPNRSCTAGDGAGFQSV
jgi:hypothetical protein